MNSITTQFILAGIALIAPIEGQITYCYVGGHGLCQGGFVDTPNNILVRDKGAYKGGIRSSAGYIDCNGLQSCERANYVQAYTNLNCTGASSCKQAGFFGGCTASTGNLYCKNQQSCYVINANVGYNAYCQIPPNGDLSINYKVCYRAFINAGQDIIVDGIYAAESATFYSTNGGIYINDNYGAYTAKSLSAVNVYIRGDYGALDFTEIYIENELLCKGIKSCAYGGRAGRGGNIYSRSTSDHKMITVTFNGDNAGYGSNIYCTGNNTCIINCKNNGCNGTTINYDQINQISITPNKCAPRRRRRPDYCPDTKKIRGTAEEMKVIMESVQDGFMDDDEDEFVVLMNDIESVTTSNSHNHYNYVYIGFMIGVVVIGLIIFFIVTAIKQGRNEYKQINDFVSV